MATSNLVRIIKLEEELLKMKKEIEDDERYHYPPAPVQINTPLALEQVSMKARMSVINKVLKLIN